MRIFREIAEFFESIEDGILAIGRIEHTVERIENRQEAIMSDADEINLKLDELNQKTNEAADRLRQIIAAIEPGMTDEEVEAIKARIQTESDRLGTWGQDNANPLP